MFIRKVIACSNPFSFHHNFNAITIIIAVDYLFILIDYLFIIIDYLFIHLHIFS